jgi:uncharacterized membrane protein
MNHKSAQFLAGLLLLLLAVFTLPWSLVAILIGAGAGCSKYASTRSIADSIRVGLMGAWISLVILIAVALLGTFPGGPEEEIDGPTRIGTRS